MKRGIVDNLMACAHANGNGCAVRARAAIYGTRYSLDEDAGTAPARGAFGKAPRSVWQGPRQILGGAPVLRRDRSA